MRAFIFVTMHPKIASFLAELQLEERHVHKTIRRGAPNISFAAARYIRAPEVPRSSPSNISLAEIPAPQYPYRELRRTTPELPDSAIFRI